MSRLLRDRDTSQERCQEPRASENVVSMTPAVNGSMGWRKRRAQVEEATSGHREEERGTALGLPILEARSPPPRGLLFLHAQACAGRQAASLSQALPIMSVLPDMSTRIHHHRPTRPPHRREEVPRHGFNLRCLRIRHIHFARAAGEVASPHERTRQKRMAPHLGYPLRRRGGAAFATPGQYHRGSRRHPAPLLGPTQARNHIQPHHRP